MSRLPALLEVKLDDPVAEQARASHAATLRALRAGLFAEAELLQGVELANATETPIAHKLGRTPRVVLVSPPRGVSLGAYQETITQTAATTMAVDSTRQIRSVRVTAGTAALGVRTIGDSAATPTTLIAALNLAGSLLGFEANVTSAVVVYEPTRGAIEEIRSSTFDRSKFVVLQATGYGATVTVDVVVA